MDVQSSKNFAALDGYIGLAPDDPTNGPSFIAELNNQHIIDATIVGIDLNPPPNSSTITLGGYSDSIIESEIRYYS